MKFLFSVFVFLFTFNLFSQVSLVKDINIGTSEFSDSSPKEFVEMGGYLYFTAETIYGLTILKSDGTVNGTNILRDSSGNIVEVPSKLKVVGNKIFFEASYPNVGLELWCTDGTEEGTYFVKDVRNGPLNANFSNFCEHNNELFFTALSDVYSNHILYKSDGTSIGTQIVDVGVSLNFTSNLISFGSQVFYSQSGPGNQINLWKTDGTPSGTSCFTNYTDVDNFFIFNNKLYFTGSESTLGNGLYYFDTLTNTTSLICNGSEFKIFEEFNGKFYFSCTNSLYGNELWSTDGSPIGTSLFLDIVPGVSSSFPTNCSVLNNQLIFTTYPGLSYLPEFWKSDGTIAGTNMFYNDTIGVSSDFILNDSKLIFFASGNNGLEVYTTDGTNTGTSIVRDIIPGSQSGIVSPDGFSFNNKLFFAGKTIDSGEELWISDGTNIGTYLFKDINDESPSYPRNFVANDSSLFFTAIDSSFVEKLFITNGTSLGTFIIEENMSPIGEMVNLNGWIYFSGYPNIYDGRELYKTDGTPNSAQIVCNPTAGVAQSTNPVELTVSNNKVFFLMPNGINTGSYDLFSTDGVSYTTSGTIHTTFNSTERHIWPINGGVCYLNYYDNNNLWFSDGLNSNFLGSVEIQGIYNNTNGYALHNGVLYFPGKNAAGDIELWKSSGTGGSTQLFFNLNITGSSNPSCFTIIGNDLFINCNLSNTNVCSIVRINLLTNQIVSIKELSSLTSYNKMYEIESLNNGYIIKTAIDNSDNKELLWYNGIDSLKSILIFSQNTSDLEKFQKIDSVIYFINYVNNSKEVWITDGTKCGTKSISESIQNLDQNILATNLSSVNNELVFSAKDQIHHQELWKYTFEPYISNNINLTYCSTYNWNGILLDSTDEYCQTFTSNSGIDSIVTLNFSLVTSLFPLEINTFSTPASDSICSGNLAIEIDEISQSNSISVDSLNFVNVQDYFLIDSLCPGIHELSVIDFCGDTVSQPFVIPVDSNYVFNNPFIDSIAVDSLGTTITNCNIYYNSIDTAYIDSLWSTGNQVNVIWNIVDSNGSNLDTTTFDLMNGSGVYWLQLSVFCPTKSTEDYFTVTQAIYFGNGGAYLVGLDDYEHLQDYIGLFPNPTSNSVTITFNSTNTALVKMYDTQGKFIQNSTLISGESLSLEFLEKGVYFLSIEYDGNLYLKKVIKN